MTRRSLAIAIPTFRRSAILAECLVHVMDEAQQLGVPIYISDDSDDDETEKLAAQLVDTGLATVHYRRNSPALGHDRNVLGTLLWPDEDYVWLLGDARWIKRGQLTRIVEFLGDQDLVFVNSHSTDTRTIPQVTGESARALIRDMLWHQTMTGATIYHRRVCSWAAQNVALKRNFPQLSVILGYASVEPVQVGWFGEPSIGTVKKPSYWSAASLDVFVDDWAAVVGAYPAVVSPNEISRIVKSHSANMNLFSGGYMVQLKAKGQLGWRSLKRPHFLDAMHLSRWVVLGIIVTPPILLSIALRIKSGLRSR